MSVYLDNAATTSLRKEALDAMMPYLTTEYGNPSSQNDIGTGCHKAVEDARKVIAESINAEPEEIFFTSGGSEANSWAIKGTLFKYSRNIITTPIEHHSLLNACETISSINGGLIWFLSVDKHGFISLDNMNELADRYEDGFISVMMVNNELGTIEPIKEIGKALNGKDYIFHTDAVQAYGHMSIDVKDLRVDMLSASAHKINGPKGVGFLYVRKDIQQYLRPLISGGQQERYMRGGTENVPGIVGFAKAAELAMSEMEEVNRRNSIMQSHLIGCIQMRGGHVNSSLFNSSPSHLSFRFDGIKAELWNEFFNEQSIYVSSGSACNSLSGEPSHVLTSVGLGEKHADESIRVSFGKDTTSDDVKQFEKALDIGLELFRGSL